MLQTIDLVHGNYKKRDLQIIYCFIKCKEIAKLQLIKMAKLSFEGYTDNDLMDLVRLDDNRLAFSEIYNRYWDKIYLVAANTLCSAEDAEECVQDVFCSLWNRRHTVQLKYSLYTYLAVAVKYRVINTLASAYQQRAKSFQRDLDDLQLFTPSSDAMLLEKELFQELESALLLLPEKCRLVFRMSREDAKSHKQIAEELNISVKTVNNHLTKAIKDLTSFIGSTSLIFVFGAILIHYIIS